MNINYIDDEESLKVGESAYTKNCTTPGKIEKITCIGYTAYIKYNSEGNIINWYFNKKGKWQGYGDTTIIFKTTKDAMQFIKKKIESDPDHKHFVRKYFSIEYIHIKDIK